MKALLSTFFILLILTGPLHFPTQANIPNHDFESWLTDTLYEEPAELFTLNPVVYAENEGNVNVTKSEDHLNGNYSAKLRTIETTGGDTAQGAVSNFDIFDEQGGLPVSTTPDSVTGYYKYDIAPGDTAYIIVLMELMDNIISFTEIPITGTNGSFTRFSYALQQPAFPVTPDTVMFAVSSSDLDNPLPGSELYLDKISIREGNNVLYSNDLSTWEAVVHTYPEHWVTTDAYSEILYNASSVTQTPESYSGDYAVNITTISVDSPLAIGMLGSSDPLVDPDGTGFPISTHPYTLNGFYKYHPAADDSSSAAVIFTRWDDTYNVRDTVHTVRHAIPEANQYEPFSIPLDMEPEYNFDTVHMYFSASNVFSSGPAHTGSELYLDSLYFNYNFPPPEAPALIHPQNGKQNIDTAYVDFTWEKKPWTDYYELQVAGDSAFTDIFYDQDSILDTTYTAYTSLEEESTYYWRVRAVNDQGPGNWSASWHITTLSTLSVPDNVILKLPDSNAEEVNPEQPYFEWQPATYAAWYNLEIAEEPDFLNVVYNTDSLENTSHNANIILDEDADYYWRVKAYNHSGESDWSYVWPFSTGEIPPPLPGTVSLITPDSNAQEVDTIDPRFEWHEAGHASMYLLEVASDPFFNTLIYSADSLTDTTHSSNLKLNENTTYYWRVRAKNASGNGPWSEIWLFNTAEYVPPVPGRVQLVSPDSNAGDVDTTNPAFTWQSVEHASWYTLEIAEDTDFLNVIYHSDSLESTTYSAQINLAGNSTYYWRVRAFNESDYGAWAYSRPFHTPSVNVLNAKKPTGTQIKVYPNPVRHQLHIEIDDPTSDKLYWFISDLSGKRILDGKLTITSDAYTAEIRLNTLNEGIYLLTIKNDDAYVRKQILVVE